MGKRGQNEGSIYKLSDGRWRAALSLGWQKNAEGRAVQVRRTFNARTRRECQDWLAKVLRDRQLGLPVAVEKQTVAQFLNRWLEDCARPAVRPKTYDSYRQLARLYLVPGLGKVHLAKLAPQQVQTFLNEKVESGLSPRTVQYTHAVLRHALNQALKWGLVVRNVATLVSPPQVRRPEVQPLTPEQARRFLRAIEGHRLEALFSTALAIGLRQGEAFGLRWPDVDLDAGTLAVRSTLQRLNGKPVFAEPKTARSRRTIALPAVAIAALRRHEATQGQERRVAGSRWTDYNLVFSTPIGTPLDPPNVLKTFQGILKAAGLPRLRFHDLRHTCATLLLAQGVHPRVVMEVLGHSQISLTMDTYSHVIPAMLGEVAAKMDAILSPVATRVATKGDSERPN